MHNELILAGFGGMFVPDGLPEVTDRAFVSAAGACLSELGEHDRLASSARAAQTTR